ncbi:hypothetical protein [Magnetospirillum molischianum]|uniref:Uncharacterized protein n=1 Tax=Magnetospirillum molischianum DSM 120 TaxID=1150626 RepID=H8FRV3_MAGML|nr:hypothetical protein [Magnetospirillum molischianum]CCG41091.1 conserved hypothetical protein [Magnetospirillum molischianum DSM 120]
MNDDDGLKAINDSDMDSLFVLPLSIIPLQTPALQAARLIKNVRLRSVVEIFSDAQTGSGQVEVEALPAMFNWPADQVHPDLMVLRRLALLPSYDVYSLRISLREHGIMVNDYAALKLSPEKATELTRYMVMFTRPLMKMIYSGEDVNFENYDDLLRLFRDPDVKKARVRLESMAQSLNIEVFDVPRFLEDYGDTFMSLSYFRHCLDRLEPYFTACLRALAPIRSHFQLRQNINLMKTCDMVEEVINSMSATITGRLEVFEKRTGEMWENISQEEFRAIRTMVERYHITIGAALCGLTVIMSSFAKMFPRPNSGGPIKRADFIMTEMIQGIELIRDVEKRYMGT